MAKPNFYFIYCISGLWLRPSRTWYVGPITLLGCVPLFCGPITPSLRDTLLKLCIKTQLKLWFVSSHFVIFLIWNTKCYKPRAFNFGIFLLWLAFSLGCTCVFLFSACVLGFCTLSNALDLSLSCTCKEAILQTGWDLVPLILLLTLINLNMVS